MSENQYDRPLPEVNSFTAPFWDYCKKHELRMQFCNRCNQWVWYPKALCPKCGRIDKIEWKKLSGKGIVYSFTVIRQVIDNAESFNRDIPFVIGLIELEEGPRIYSNIINVKPDDVSIGDKVEVVFEDVTKEISLPKFKKV
jgi:uncharacterized OB-fold protein